MFGSWKSAQTRANYNADIKGGRQKVTGHKGIDGKWRYATSTTKKDPNFCRDFGKGKKK